MRRPDAVSDTSVQLWEQLSTELIHLIGEGGFQALYERSVHIVKRDFPWLVASVSPQPGDARFASLKIRLAGRDSTEASKASITLLITFIDILANLIGEILTTSILRSAWGDDASDSAVKEIQK